MYQFTYYISLKKRGNHVEITYNIISDKSDAAFIKIGGKSASSVFNNIISVLARYGGCTPVKISGDETIYSIREDLGPIVGTYLILVRKARNVEKWNKFFYELIEEKYVGIIKAFTSFLEIAIEMSRYMNSRETGKRKKQYILNPRILNALSSALKQFTNKIIEYEN